LCTRSDGVSSPMLRERRWEREKGKTPKRRLTLSDANGLDGAGWVERLEGVYLLRCLIFLRLRLRRLTRFFLHLARIAVGVVGVEVEVDNEMR